MKDEKLTVEFWRKRIEEARKNNRPHPVRSGMYEQSPEEAEASQQRSRRIIKHYIHQGDVVLDLGCGCGDLYDIIYPNPCCRYVGIDLVPEFLQEARSRFFPEGFLFLRVDLSEPDPLRIFLDNQFSIVIGRYVEGTIGGSMPVKQWQSVIDDLLRISPKVVFFSVYDDLGQECVIRRDGA